MSTILKCSNCSREFKNKGGLTRHTNSGTCRRGNVQQQPQIENLALQIQKDNENNQQFTKEYGKLFFTDLFDFLRSEGITDREAFDNIQTIFGIKFVEKFFYPNDNFYITFNYPQDFMLNNQQIEAIYNNTGNNFLFSHLLNYLNVNINDKSGLVVKIMKEIVILFSQHIHLKHFFPDLNILTIKNQSTYMRIINKINSINLENTSQDIVGDAFENFLSRTFISKTLAQFFTKDWIRNFMVRAIDPKLMDDGTFPIIMDPCCGSCGFLLSSLRYLIKQQTENKKINWDYATKQGIIANDIDNNIISSGRINFLINTGQIFNKHQKKDSLREQIDDKADILLSNPPFGIKKLVWDEVNTNNKTPFKTADGNGLFLQMLFAKLNIGGTMSIVFPTGALFFSRKNKAFIDIRKALMLCGKINYIITLPKGSFENTSISCCIFNYTKYREFIDVCEFKNTKAKQTRSFKEKDNDGQNIGYYTTETTFYKIKDIPKENEEVNPEFICKTDLNKMIEKDFSFDDKDYFSNIKKDTFLDSSDVKTYKIGEICDLERGTRITKEQCNDGIYEVYGGGGIIGNYDKYNVNENSITISCAGNAGKVFRHSKKIYLIDSGLYVSNIKNDIILEDYLYLYMKYILEKEFIELQRGTAQANINKDFVKEKLIRVPSIYKQKEFIDMIYNNSNETVLSGNLRMQEITKIKIDRLVKDFILNSTNITKIKIGDICDIGRGQPLTKEQFIDGEYEVYGAGKLIGKHNIFNLNENTILIARVGNAGTISICKNKIFLIDSSFYIKDINTQYVNLDYFYYHLKFITENELISLQRGTAQQTIVPTNIKEVQINYIPLNEQLELVNKVKNYENKLSIYEEDYNDTEQFLINTLYQISGIIKNEYDEGVDEIKDEDEENEE